MLRQGSTTTGMFLEEVAALILEARVPFSRKLTEIAEGPHFRSPTDTEGIFDDASRISTLRVPVSRKLMKELDETARGSSNGKLAMKILRQCVGSALVESCLGHVEQALEGLSDDRKKTAEEALTEVAYRLAHREQLLALESSCLPRS